MQPNSKIEKQRETSQDQHIFSIFRENYKFNRRFSMIFRRIKHLEDFCFDQLQRLDHGLGDFRVLISSPWPAGIPAMWCSTVTNIESNSVFLLRLLASTEIDYLLSTRYSNYPCN